MKLYVGMDLHANNNYLALVDAKGKRQEQKRLPFRYLIINPFISANGLTSLESNFYLADWETPMNAATAG